VSDDLATREEEVPTAAESTAVVAAIASEAARPGWRVRLAEQPTIVLAGVFVVLYAITCSSPARWRSSPPARRCAC
jgi:hypothetical protein